LRVLFPKLQFVCTTHDPLCLRGLETGEVVVLQAKADGTEAVPMLRPIRHLRADQLLTSNLFGLMTTRDRSFERSSDRYQELVLKESRSASDEAELRALTDELREASLSGETEAERVREQARSQQITEAMRILNNLERPITRLRRRTRKNVIAALRDLKRTRR
jgi:predicted ATP-binding protein involved in virulence